MLHESDSKPSPQLIQAHLPRLLPIFILAILTLILRFINLSHLPPGLFTDEASIGYSAYSLAQTGHDEHGQFLPLYFRAFGEYKNPLLIYTTAIAFIFFQPSVFILRLIPSLIGLASILVFYLLLRPYLKPSLALLTSIIFALNPTHFLLSRVVFEVITLPLSIIIALSFLNTYRSHPNHRSWLLFAISLGLMFYTYSTARLLAPLWFLLAILTIRPARRLTLTSSSLFLLLLTPALHFHFTHDFALTSRFTLLSGIDHSNLSALPQHLFTNLKQHFSYSYFFLSGDSNLRHSPPFASIMAWTTIPVLLAGLITFFRSLNRYSLFLLLALTTSFLPSLLTSNQPHTLRLIPILVFAHLLLASGLHHLHSTRFSSLVIPISAVIITHQLFALNQLFQLYPTIAPSFFEQEQSQLFTHASHLPGPYYFPTSLKSGYSYTWAFIKRQPPQLQTQSIPHDTYYQDTFTPTIHGTHILPTPLCLQWLPSLQPLTTVIKTSNFCLFHL